MSLKALSMWKRSRWKVTEEKKLVLTEEKEGISSDQQKQIFVVTRSWRGLVQQVGFAVRVEVVRHRVHSSNGDFDEHVSGFLREWRGRGPDSSLAIEMVQEILDPKAGFDLDIRGACSYMEGESFTSSAGGFSLEALLL